MLMRNRDPHRENVENIVAICLPSLTMQHIRESPSVSHAMRKSAWNGGPIDSKTVLFSIRGRPLMIWGAEEKSEMNLFFPRDSLFKFFPPGEGPPKFFFSRFPPHPSLMVVPLDYKLQTDCLIELQFMLPAQSCL